MNPNSQSNFTNNETQTKTQKNCNFHNSKKDLNIKDFISQKNKFYIQDFFNEKEAEKFLNSKKKALMEIKLDDDDNISNDEYEIEINKINNNILRTELNKSDIEENNQQNKKSKIKTKKDKSASPKRKRTTKAKKHNKNNNDNDFDIKHLFTMNALDKNNNDNSHDSNYIYKFIIDNANETKENFFKKLKKEIK